MINKIRDDRQLRALTGLGFAEFERLLPIFSAVYEAERQTTPQARRWLQEQTGDDGGQTALCAVLLQNLSNV